MALPANYSTRFIFNETQGTYATDGISGYTLMNPSVQITEPYADAPVLLEFELDGIEATMMRYVSLTFTDYERMYADFGYKLADFDELPEEAVTFMQENAGKVFYWNLNSVVTLPGEDMIFPQGNFMVSCRDNGIYIVDSVHGERWMKGEEKFSKEQGDLNDDNEVNVLDLVALNKHLHSKEILLAHQFNNTDMNHDGVINIIDYCLLKKELLQKNQ